MRMRWGAYAGVSSALAGGVVLKALAQRPNFYSAAVYLSQSSFNLMIITNFVFVVASSFLLFLQRLLYGPLRPIEVEQLYEKAWFAVTETCLAMTIFRGEIGAWFLVMFFALLAGKVWGWIGEGRVEILEQQPPHNPRLFHTRLAASLILSVLFDTAMLEYVVKQVMEMARPDMMVMFGFEFAVLSILSLSTLARYGISLVEIMIVRGQKFKRVEEMRKERREAREAELREQGTTADGAQSISTEQTQRSSASDQPGTMISATTTPAIQDEPIDEAEIEVEGWEDKGRWIFYLDLTTDFFKLVTYLSFFFILLIFYGLPIHIMRDVFLTVRSFFKRIADFLRYRTATRDMNQRYPDATAEDIGREDVCIICREEMRAIPRPEAAADAAAGQQEQPARQRRTTNPVADRMRPKKLPCGHVLHFSCLRSWLERQQICPTCRRPVVPTHHINVGGPAIAGGPAGLLQGIQDGMAAGGGQQGQQPNHANGQPDQGNENRARVFQIGPLRIGIGAGRGNMIEDLAQRIHEGEVEAAPAQPANNPNGPRQYGFGFGFGRPRIRTTHRAAGTISGTVQAQLDHAERQIQQEINNLRLSATELNVVRMLQGELTRLRGLRQGTGAISGTSTAPTITSTAIQQPTATGFVADGRQNVLEAGSEALPQGLHLPEGWTMMPLQRMQPGTQLPTMGVGQAMAPGHGMPQPVLPAGTFHVPAPGVLNQPQPMPDNTGHRHRDLMAEQIQRLQRQHHEAAHHDHQQHHEAADHDAAHHHDHHQQLHRAAINANTLQANATAADADDDLRQMFPNPVEPAAAVSVGAESGDHQNSSSSVTSNGINGTHAQSHVPAPADSLPMWGSAAQDQASTTSSTRAIDGEEDAANSASRRKTRNPTVEDLVEDPD